MSIDDIENGVTGVITYTYDTEDALVGIDYDQGRDGVVETRERYERQRNGLIEIIFTSRPPHSEPYWAQRYLWNDKQHVGLLEYDCSAGIRGRVTYEYDESGYPRAETSYVEGEEMPDHRWTYGYENGLLVRILAEENGRWNGLSLFTYDTEGRIKTELLQSPVGSSRTVYSYICSY